MPSRKKTAPLIGLAALATLGLGTAFATQQDDGEELQRLESSKMSLAQAVQVAETEYKGKSVSASLDMKQATPAFVVEVMNASGSQSVLVDTETGKLTVLQTKGENEDGENDAEDAD